jgi:predicted ArsR family transcriptional regulator
LTTKDKILDLLKRENSLTVNDFVTVLNITHMAVRKHLNTLEKDGLILSKNVKQPVGRPIQTFHISEKGDRLFPTNYEYISVELIKDVEALHGRQTINEIFKRREERQILEYTDRLENIQDDVEKLQELTRIQNEKNYMADLQQVENNTYELTEYNCPIFALADEFHIACQCETDLFKRVLGNDSVERVCCRSEGDRHCKFRIKLKELE